MLTVLCILTLRGQEILDGFRFLLMDERFFLLKELCCVTAWSYLAQCKGLGKK